MTDQWLSHIFLSSVPIRKLNEVKLPTGMASGCLVDYGGKRLLLTVAHATSDQSNWAIEIRHEKDKGTLCHQLGPMNFLRSGSVIDGQLVDIDFSYVEVPNELTAYRQELDRDGNVASEIPIQVFALDLEVEPNKEERYGFSGNVRPFLMKDGIKIYLETEFKVYSNLTYS